MKRKLVTILIGCMALGLFGCGSGLSDTTKRLTPKMPIIQEMRISRQRLTRQKRKRKMAARKRPLVTVTVSLP